MKRLRTILTVVSGVVCCLLLTILPFSYHLSLWCDDEKGRTLMPNDFSLSLTPHFHMELYEGGIVFFSGGIPYLDGISSMSDEKGVVYKGGHAHWVNNFSWHAGDCWLSQETLIGERGEFVERDRDYKLPGIYYRYFDVADSPPTEWNLLLSLWYPILLTSVLPMVWIFRRVRSRPKKPIKS